MGKSGIAVTVPNGSAPPLRRRSRRSAGRSGSRLRRVYLRGRQDAGSGASGEEDAAVFEESDTTAESSSRHDAGGAELACPGVIQLRRVPAGDEDAAVLQERGPAAAVRHGAVGRA